MSEFRVEKRREAAELTLSTGATVAGYFFLAGSSQLHSGPERVGDVLNLEAGFFPFEAGVGDTALYNRAQVLMVSLPTPVIEAQLDAGYDVATRRTVRVLLSNGETVTGNVVVYRPPGRDRLSDYAHIDERFRYVELPDRTILINSAHIVALTEVTAQAGQHRYQVRAGGGRGLTGADATSSIRESWSLNPHVQLGTAEAESQR